MKLIHNNQPLERAALITEAVVAMAMLTIAVLPLAFSFHHERTLLKASYYRAIAMEIVDGEMEVLAAGGWHAFGAGTSEYPVRAGAATNLPPGKFLLTIEPDKVRLEWKPGAKSHGGPVVREVKWK